MENQVVKAKSGLATAGLVLGIIGAVLAFIPIVRFVAYPLGGLAFIFGIIPLCQKKSVAKSIVSIVLAAVSIILTITLQAVTVKAAANAVDTAAKKASSSLNDATGDNTDKILKDDLKVKIGDFKIIKGEYIDEYELPVSVKNKTDKKCSFTIQIEAVDKSGNRIDDDTVYVNDLNAGQSQDFKAFTLVTSDKVEKFKKAEFKIVEVSKF